jgi:O-antigen/teichoic acid export membrane protein
VTPESSSTQDLRSRVIRGLGWTAFSQISVQVMALVTTIFIAHLLTPSDVGLVAMATVFSALAMMLADLALGAALVQRETLTEEYRSTAFWLTVSMGVGLAILGVLLAGPIAALYGEPEVEPLFQVISITFVLATLGATQNALLVRDMQFRSLEVRTVLASGLAGGVAIALALLGAGPWAIVGQKLTVNAASTVLVWRASPWRPHFMFSMDSVRDQFGYGGWIIGSRFLAYLKGYGDNYLIGRYAGPAALGAYSIAYNVMLVPLVRLVGPVQQVFFPALSRIRDPARVGTAWLSATRMVALVTVPAFAGMAVVAPDFVSVVLGDQWDAAVPVLEILCWVGILQSVTWLTVTVLEALGRTAWLFRFTVVTTPVTLAGFAIGVQWGIVGVATAFAITTTLTTPFYVLMPLRATGTSAVQYVRAVSGVAEATVIMVVVLLALRLTVFDSLAPALSLAIAIAVGAAVYVPLAAWRVPEARRELRSLRARPVEHAGRPAIARDDFQAIESVEG